MKKSALLKSFAMALAVTSIAGFGKLAYSAELVPLMEGTLVQGIPGTGELTLQEVKKFLEDPKNHVELTPVLPSNLQAGAANIFIPEDNPITHAKVELGRQLFFDRRLSVDSTVSCADCHAPNVGYGFNSKFGIGIQGLEGNRNSPVAFNRIISTAQFWDGRALTLEEQAIGPIENPVEMGHTHDACVAFIMSNDTYRAQFLKIFGREPVIEDVGKAIATFERTLVTGPSPYDYYETVRQLEEAFAEDLEDLELLKEEDPELYTQYTEAKKASDAHPMSESAKRGRELFFTEKSNCSACHVGVNFTDEIYHNLGVGMEAATPDLGRYEVTKEEKDKGAFKTPTLRNITQTGPFMHDGSQERLEEVVEYYAKGGHPNPYLSDKIKKLDLSPQDKADLVEFMKALTGALPVVEVGRLPR